MKRLLKRFSWRRHATMLAIVCGVAGSPGVSGAQPRLLPGAPGAQTGMATRSVSAYLELERQLADAIARRDGVAVRAMLAADFEFRSPELSDALTADAWVQQALRSPASNPFVRELSVRDGEQTAIVAFLLDRARSRQGRRSAATEYVVDVWDQASHRLLVRYASQPVRALPRGTRPSGRE